MNFHSESSLRKFLTQGTDINSFNSSNTSILELILNKGMLVPLEQYGKCASFELWSSPSEDKKFSSRFHQLLSYAPASPIRFWDDTEEVVTTRPADNGKWDHVVISVLEAYPKLLQMQDEDQ